MVRIWQERGGAGVIARRIVRRVEKELIALSRLPWSNWRDLGIPASPDSAALERVLDVASERLRQAFSMVSGLTPTGKPMVAGEIRRDHARLIWDIVRCYRPLRVLETGVCNGLSSAVILEALHQNGEGALISIDQPEFADPDRPRGLYWEHKAGSVVAPGQEVGWLAPEDRRDRWRLLLGRSQDLLEDVLGEAAPDLFIHDSEHSYDNMFFEFSSAYRALRPGGVLVATDIDYNRAFDDFWRTVKRTGARRAFVDRSCAIIIKHSEQESGANDGTRTRDLRRDRPAL
ncbi:hypothetical protein BH11PSE2_BH11PSE2_02630 [soil metagenome]